MRTKTLLIAAAALAVGIISSEAQVYSQNVVGYINITVTNHTFVMIANQLDTGSNTLNNVLPIGGVSQSTSVLFWNRTRGAFDVFTYMNSGDSPDGNNGWYDGDGNPCTNTLTFTQGAFINNPSGADVTFTMVGQVLQGTNQYTVTPGFNIYSLPQPVGGQPIDTYQFPAVSSFDSYLQWNPSIRRYNPALYYMNSADSSDGNSGWYDADGNPQDANSALWPQAGQSFFINHANVTSTWTNGFVVP